MSDKLKRGTPLLYEDKLSSFLRGVKDETPQFFSQFEKDYLDDMRIYYIRLDNNDSYYELDYKEFAFFLFVKSCYERYLYLLNKKSHKQRIYIGEHYYYEHNPNVHLTEEEEKEYRFLKTLSNKM